MISQTAENEINIVAVNSSVSGKSLLLYPTVALPFKGWFRSVFIMFSISIISLSNFLPIFASIFQMLFLSHLQVAVKLTSNHVEAS